jgi:RNA polymerase sigma factor (sigma-70 family)
VGDETAFQAFAARLVDCDDSPNRDDAARELLARYSSRLVALARGRISARLATKADAEDVLQSVLRTFFRRLDAGEVELRSWGSLWGFLSLATLRKCQRNAGRYATDRRDVGREVSLEIGGDGGAWELSIPDREPTPDEVAAFADELQSLLEGLDERERRAVELVLAGEAPVTVARRLGCSRRTVRRSLAYVRSRAAARRERQG